MTNIFPNFACLGAIVAICLAFPHSRLFGQMRQTPSTGGRVFRLDGPAAPPSFPADAPAAIAPPASAPPPADSSPAASGAVPPPSARSAIAPPALAEPDPRFRLPEETPASSTAAADPQGGGPELLLERAMASLAGHQSIVARLRQRVDLFGRQLIGSGMYLQQSGPAGLQVRLDLKNGIGDEMATIEQVCDGAYLWQYSDLLEEPSITRVDMVRVRKAIADNPQAAARRMSMNDLAMYGLPSLLDALRRSFHFHLVEAGRLDVMPVWVISGRWRPTAIQEVSKELAEQAAADRAFNLEKLPPQVPEEVRLYVGQDDLFPYRIEYLRRPAGQQVAAASPSAMTPVVTIELYDVRLNTPIDPRQFSYHPGSLNWFDVTEEYLKPIRPKKAEEEEDE